MKRVCVIGGFPRAGTRQFVDIINAHPSCELKGEVFSSSFQLLGKFVKQADMDHSGKWSEKAYLRNRSTFIFGALAGITKGSSRPYREAVDVAGFKSPRIELNFETMKILFQSNDMPVTFFYCVRKVSENFLSAKSTFGTSPEKFSDRTRKSIESFLKIRKVGIFNTQLLSLDAFISSSDSAKWVVDNIFSHLPEIEATKNDAEKFLSRVTNSNSTEKAGKKRVRKLTDIEVDFFESDAELRKSVSMVEDMYGISLWDIGN